MVKQASSVEGVFLVGPAGGVLRPWCGKCHKFLKSENAAHDCTPVNLAAVRRSGGAGKTKRRIRLTPKNKETLSKVFDAAALGEDAVRLIGKLAQYSKKKSVSGKKIAQLIKGMNGLSKRGAKRSAHLKKRFL